MNTPNDNQSLNTWGSPAQSDLLYPGQWTQAVDTRFIELLQESKNRGLFDPIVNNPDAVNFALENLNFDLGTFFSYSDCTDRLHVLRKRYIIFRHLLRKHGVRYEQIDNTVTAPAWVWVQMHDVDPFVEAYMVNGDPSWNELQDLFREMYAAPPAEPHEVVVLTSDSASQHNAPNVNRNQPQDPEIILIDDSNYSNNTRSRRLASSNRFSGNSVNQPQYSVDTLCSTNAHEPVPDVRIRRKGKRTTDSVCRGSNQL